jgi:MFS family permease
MYTALTPLIPSLKGELALSKPEVGMLVAAYPAGVAVSAIPIGAFSSRVGARASAVLSLVLLGTTAIAVGLLKNLDGLVAARALQGVGAGLCAASSAAWLVETGTSNRRARDVSFFTSAAAFGSMVGPAMGGVGAAVGRAGVFLGIGLVAFSVGAIAFTVSGPPRLPPIPVRDNAESRRSRLVLGGHGLVAVPGILFGITGVLVPLQLDRLGIGATGIATTYLVASGIGIVTRPSIGRAADRLGLLRILRYTLCVGGALAVALSGLRSGIAVAASAVVIVTTFGALWGPSMTYVSRQYERSGAAQALAFSFMNIPIGGGTLLGAVLAGELARATSDASAYLFASAVCAFAAVLTLHLEHVGERAGCAR